jgi:hypothetical protein
LTGSWSLAASRAARLFCAYAFTLFVNPGGALPVAEMAEAVGVDRVLGPDEFP